MRVPALSRSLVVLAALAPLPAAAADAPPASSAVKPVRLAGPGPAFFEQLGELYGVRVQVDAEFSPQTLSLRLDAADFASALRVATRLAGAFSVEQADGSVLVAADTPSHRARYRPPVERTFSLPGRTPEELTEAVRLLREVLDMRFIRLEPRSNTFTVKDTPYRLAVAEHLLQQVQAEPGEVWVSALLLEVDREVAQRLGVLPPDQAVAVHLGAGALALQREDVESLLETLQRLFELGVLPEAAVSQVGFDPVAGTVTLPPFVLFGRGGTGYAALLPGAELALSRLARATRSVRHFTLRARDGQEATLFAGERFPVIFTTFSSIFIPEIVQELIRQGRFVPPVPATRYEELGVRLTVRPRLHPGREISLELKLDQKALTGEDLNGIPTFSNRALAQQVRLREAESLLVTGLRSRTEQPSSTGLPLLGSVPGLGRLFRRSAPARRATELLILITPRVVRHPVPDRAALRPLYVGTETEFAPAGVVPALEEEEPTPPPQPPPPPQPRPQPPPQQN